MARSFAISHSSHGRPAGQPGSAFREVSPVTHSVAGRKILRVNPSVAPTQVEADKCEALTKAGVPCKGRPAVGESLCTFHRE